MILYYQKILLISLLLFASCVKEIDIAEFSDDYADYQTDLRIEALILPSDNTAIVRIDKSVLITDTYVYDCLDNDYGDISLDSCNTLNGIWHGEENDLIGPCGDWNILIDDLGTDGVEGDPTDDDGDCGDCSITDEQCLIACIEEDSIGENNGEPDCGEPHVDETDEIIKKIHMNDCSIVITNSSTQDSCIFVYDESAESFFYEEKQELDIDSPYTEDDSFPENMKNCINNECLKGYSSLWDNESNSYDTLYFGRYSSGDFLYYSSIMPYGYYQSVQHFYDEDNGRWIYFHGHPDAATEVETIQGNVTSMTEAVVADFIELDDSIPINKFYYDIFTFSESYKNYYFFDQLDLLDPNRTNLRKLDDGGNATIPVMGAFGAMTSEKIYFEIIDCLIYDTQETCENEGLTKSVCQWYDDQNNTSLNGNSVPSEYLPLCAPKKLPAID